LGPFERVLKENYNYFVYMHRNRQVTWMQLGILIDGAWNRAASIQNVVFF
jgi:hypothetical protein